MRGGCITNLINGLNRCIRSCIKTYGKIRPLDIVVDRPGNADRPEARLLFEE